MSFSLDNLELYHTGPPIINNRGMGVSAIFDPMHIQGLVEPILKGLNISGAYAPYLGGVAVLLVGGFFAPLIGAFLRLSIAIVIETFRVPLRWMRGIRNELARAIYQHGPLLSRQIARPLALALLIGAGYLVLAASVRGKSAIRSTSQNATAASSCSGEIVDLACPRPR